MRHSTTRRRLITALCALFLFANSALLLVQTTQPVQAAPPSTVRQPDRRSHRERPRPVRAPQPSGGASTAIPTLVQHIKPSS
jgi:hypothetical protein